MSNSFSVLQQQVAAFLFSEQIVSSEDFSTSSSAGTGSIAPSSPSNSSSSSPIMGDVFESQYEEVISTEPYIISALPMRNRRELGSYAQWTLSSAKLSNGVRQLQDPDSSVFWQSDGKYPHIITLQFPKKYRVYEVALYLDHMTDESYTPLEIDVLVGTSERDVELINSSCIEKPNGYLIIPTLNDEAVPNLASNLASPQSRDGTSEVELHPAFVAVIQIVIKSSHQNGKDIHVRNLNILGAVPPRPEIGLPPGENYSTSLIIVRRLLPIGRYHS